jgi:hypothetical protein
LDDAFSTYYSEKRRIKNAEMKIEHKLIKNTLEVLNDSDDIGSAIHEMFSVVGKAFSIDRILMYEVDMNEKEIFSTYSGGVQEVLEEALCAASRFTSLRIGDFIAVELSPATELASRKEGSAALKASFCGNDLYDLKILF